MAQQVKEWNKSKLLLQLPVYHSSYLDFQWRKVPNFLHYYDWQEPLSKWHTFFVQIPTFALFFLFLLFFGFFFSILDIFYINFWDWKIACAWKKQFHSSRKYAFSYKNCLTNIANIFAHLTTKLLNFCRVWYAGSTILNICINETRQYYRNAYLREIWNCFFHAQAIFQSQSLYKNWQTGMTLGHKSFVTQFLTKEVLYYDDFLKNYWKCLHGLCFVSFLNFCVSFRVLVISYRCTVLSYFVPTKTRPTYMFEDKQMKTGMTLGHKSFVTQFSTKEVLYYDDFLKNYWKYLHGLLDSHKKLYIWNYILQGVTTLWYNIHL
jgi:hypothetical protein